MSLCTVTGNVNVLLNLSPNITYSGTVRFTLILPPGVTNAPAVISSGQSVLPSLDVPVNSDGSFSAQVQANDGIIPAGTLYEVMFLISNVSAAPNFYNFTGTAVNLNTLTPSTLPAFVSPNAVFSNQLANLVFAGPPSGPSALPAFRPLVAADLPPILASPSFSVITSGTNTTAAMHVGTGATLNAIGTGTITATTITGSLDTVVDGLDFQKTPFGEGPIPLIFTGNFEQAGFGGSGAMPPPGWIPDVPVTVSYETATPCEGSHSLKAVYPGSAGGNKISSLFFTAAQPGDVFYLSGIVKTDGVLAGTLRINFLDKNNAGIGVDPAATTTSTSCTPISVTGTAPAGTVYVVVRLGYTPNATPGTVWYDAINFYKVNVPAGQSIYAGVKSGSAALGVASVAGTPNRINVPVTTGTNGQVLTTDGGNPQQTSWTTISSTPPFSAITAGTNTNALVIGTGGSLTTSGTGTITPSFPLLAPAGTLAAPSYSFSGATSTGITAVGGLLTAVAGGASIAAFNGSGVTIQTGVLFSPELVANGAPNARGGSASYAFDSTTVTPSFATNNGAGVTSFTGAWTCTNVTPVTVNANVSTDQNLMACTVPAGTLNRVGRSLQINIAGVYSTVAASTASLTYKVKLCTVSGCGSGTVVTLLNIATGTTGALTAANFPFHLNGQSTTQTAGASSAYEAHGRLTIDITSALAADSIFTDSNTATVGTIDNTAQLFLQVTAASASASTSNSWTQRQLVAQTIN